MTLTYRLKDLRLLPLATLLLGSVAFASPPPQETATQEAKETTKETTQEAKDTTRQAGGGLKDSWVTMKVHAQFIPEDALDGSDIDVETQSGVVTLTGTVPTQTGRDRAVAIAKATDGVSKVNDRLRIAPAEADAEAARTAGQRAGEETREAGRTVGETAREAGRETREATGTAGRTVTDGWIKSKIYSQFLTEDALDDSDINVDSNRGVVTLKGAVRTDAARQRAEAIAKETDGVKSVSNNLKVDPSVR